MSEFEMNAMDQEVESVANSNNGKERPVQNAAPAGAKKTETGFWNQLDSNIQYRKFNKQRVILGVVRVVLCVLAVAALVCAMYIPEALPYIVNAGVAALIVAATITVDRMIMRSGYEARYSK